MVLPWSNIPFNDQGEPLDDITIAPDWMIEILAPGQRAKRVTSNILYALGFGTTLGWLIDPDDRSVLIFLPQQQPIFCRGSDRLLSLEEIGLELRAEELFSWLKMISRMIRTPDQWPRSHLGEPHQPCLFP